VLAWRAARHHLDERVPAMAMLEVAGRIAGLHAQVLSSAELTLAARVEELEPDAVRRQETKGRRLQITIEPFAARLRRAAEAEAERLAVWSGGELELRWADA
jgi:hypothetical protein